MLENIVVGYDGSEPAKRALDRAAVLTGYGSLLTVVTVASSSVDVERSSRLLDEAADRLLLQRVFARPLERVGGNVVEELIATVEELDADLLIVGSKKKALERLLQGSVSTSVVHRAPCDVLVTR